MTAEVHKLLKDSVYYAEKAHEVLDGEPSERSIHSGMFFLSNAVRDFAKAFLLIEDKK